VERLVTPDHAVARLGRQVLASGLAISEAQQAVERRGGGDLVVDVAASPLLDGAGAVDGVVLVLRDRSAHRRLEQLEAERERFAAFGRIAAGLAHEIKNPLGGIRGAGELLARRAETAKSKETAELVVREATRIAALVDEFMVFAHGETLRLAPVNVHRVLDDVLALLALDPLAERVDVVREYDPSIPELLADADRLTQVFLNLARNALQAMEEKGGTLTITTRMTLDHRISLSPGRPVPTLGVWFTDTGRGMGGAELRQATTPFFTTRTGGTGLGLAVADYWVAQHQGTLSLESTPGQGTRVRVTLPLRRDA
jgi:two-component system nitrogen regulation sensor histidine kinase GlnL